VCRHSKLLQGRYSLLAVNDYRLGASPVNCTTRTYSKYLRTRTYCGPKIAWYFCGRGYLV